MNSPLLSVAMPVFNSGRYLEEAINSILKQSWSDFEFLIYDDGSTDNSVEIIQNFTDPRIKLYRSDKNQGYLVHLNQGIQDAKGEYFARMDADDIAVPERFSKQISFLEKNPEIVLVGSAVYLIDEAGNNKGIQEYETDPQRIKTKLLLGNCFAHPSVMARTRILRQNPYDPDFYTAEDYHLWSRLSYSHPLANLPDPLLFYRIHSQGTSHRMSDQQDKALQDVYMYHFSMLGIKQNDPLAAQRFHKLVKGTYPSRNNKESKSLLQLLEEIYGNNSRLRHFHPGFLKDNLTGYWSRLYFSGTGFLWGILCLKYLYSPLHQAVPFFPRIRYTMRCILAMQNHPAAPPV